jgi:hypothetical protein
MSASHKNKVDTSLNGQRLCSYPNEPYNKLLDNYSKQNELSKSKVISKAIKKFFDTMPNEIKANYLKPKNGY